MKKLSLFQSTLFGIAGNAPAYGVAIATAALISAATSVSALAVLLCGLAMIGILIAYQRLNFENPSCGAAYSWVGKIISPFAGFMAGWCLLVALQFFMVSAMLAASQAILIFMELDAQNHKTLTCIIAIALLLTITYISLSGINVFGKFQSIFTLIELFFVGVIGAVAFTTYYDVILNTLFESFYYKNFFDFKQLSNGIVIAVFFFWGWDVIFNLSEETTETKSTSAKASLFSVLILILIYFSFTVIANSILKNNELQSLNTLQAITNKIFVSPYSQIALIAFLVSIIGSLDASIIQFSRTLSAKSRDGILPNWFSKPGLKTNLPSNSILLASILASILLIAGVFFESVNDVIIAGVGGSAILVACYYSLAGFACARFFKKQKLNNKYIIIAWPFFASMLLISCAIYSAFSFSNFSLFIISASLVIGTIIAMSALYAKKQHLTIK